MGEWSDAGVDAGVRFLQEHGVHHFDEWVASNIADWQDGVRIPETRRVLREAVDEVRSAILGGRFSPFPKLPRGDSEMHWGEHHHPKGMHGPRLPLEPGDQLQRNGIWVGSSGSGKSGLLKQVIYEVLTHPTTNPPHIVVCPNAKGTEYDDFTLVSPDWYPVPAHELPINILDPGVTDDGTPACNPVAYKDRICDLLVRELKPGEGGYNLLMVALDALYDSFGVYSGGLPPTLHDLSTYILAMDEHPLGGGLKVPYQTKQSLAIRLGSLVKGLPQSMTAVVRGWQPWQLAQHHVTFDYRRVGAKVAAIVTDWLIFGNFWRLQDAGIPQGSNRLGTLFFVEDAMRYTTLSPELLRDIFTDMRGAGQSLHLLLQSMDLDRVVIDNAACKIVAQLGSDTTYQAVLPNLRISTDRAGVEYQYVLAHLRPGTYLVSFNGNKGAMIHAPLPPLKPVDAATKAARFAQLRALMPTPLWRGATDGQPARRLRTTRAEQEAPTRAEAHPTPDAQGLTRAQRHLLEYLYQHRDQPQQLKSAVAKAYGGRTAAFYALIAELVKLGYLKEHDLGGRGDPKWLELLTAGHDALGHAPTKSGA